MHNPYNWIVSMKQKKARFVIQAIKEWYDTNPKIMVFLKQKFPHEYLSDVNIRHLTNILRKAGYIVGKKQWHFLQWELVREVNGQIDVVI